MYLPMSQAQERSTAKGEGARTLKTSLLKSKDGLKNEWGGSNTLQDQ